MCVDFFSFEIVVFFAHTCYLLRGIYFDLVTHTQRPIPPTRFARVFALTRIASHRNIGGWWVVLVGQRSEIPPTKVTFILVTQVRAIVCCLLIWFITQSGSCTFRPPRLLCCFPLHRRRISSDITSSPLSSTATKTQTSKRLSMATEQVGVQFSQYILIYYTVRCVADSLFCKCCFCLTPTRY